MKRIVIMFIRNFLALPGLLIQLFCYASKNDRHTEEQRYAFIKKIVRLANKGGRVTIQSSGQENIPKENGFIMYPNHQGMYDMLAIFACCDKPVTVVMKKEVKDIFLLKQVRQILRAQAMDREDVRQSLGVIMQVTKEVSEGRNYVIFPEGTRSKNGNNLVEFKPGSFKAAVKAKAPIVPVALLDSYLPFDSNSIKPVTVQVHYLPPLYYEEYAGLKTQEIAAVVKGRIEEKIAGCK